MFGHNPDERSKNLRTPDAHAGEAQALPVGAPVLFLLPGLGGGQRLFRGVPEVVPIRYMEWTDAIKTDGDFTLQFLDVKAQIEKRMPTGPVRLAGYSVGGLLAYACALAFQAEGRTVLGTVVLDAVADHDGVPATPLRKRLKKRLDDVLTFKVRAGLASLLAKPLTRKSAMPFMRYAARFRNVALPFRFDQYLHHKINMQIQLPTILPWWRKLIASEPRLQSPVFLFRSEEYEPSASEDLGWKDICTDLRVVHVAGSHHGMLLPENTDSLCSSILSALNLSKTIDRSPRIVDRRQPVRLGRDGELRPPLPMTE